VGALLKIKDIAGMQNLKVILFTAFGDPQPEIYKNDQRFAKELGAFEYLLKSQDLDEIVERIRKTLEGNPS
jgi:DNA-binding NarL/FixJ family response regulator